MPIKTIRKKRELSPEDFMARVSLYTTWTHILINVIQTILGQWLRLSRSQDNMEGAWKITSDVRKMTGAVRKSENHIDRVMDILDGADPAMWSQIRDSYKIHEAESVELNWLVVFFGRYFQTCWGRGENRQKVFELMDSMREGSVGQNAAEVFAVNTIYEYTAKEEK